MRIDRGLLGWGGFLIVLGAVPLAVRGGYLDEAVVRRAWDLWPLILIGIGLGLMLQRTKLAALGGLVVAITFGLLGGSLLATGISGPFSGCGIGVGSGAGTPFETRTGTFGAEARVDLDLSCGEVQVSSAAGSGWSVAGTDADGEGPDVSVSGDRLRVRAPERSGIQFMRGGQRWQVTLPEDPLLELDLSVNAGSARLDLGVAHVSDANVSVNAGDARLDLSGTQGLGSLNASVNAGAAGLTLPAESLTGSVSANLGSIELCVPSGVGLRFRGVDDALSSNNFTARGLSESDGTWTSADFASATIRMDLSTSASLGSITLNPENGCD
ncbi:MAG: hypothetical protein A2V85_01120 [Chloroflexi bacterium RBG_16_72_14]|nr:MAG: hypothetical protein A2V85_01120 [Chloroflexi bacterium RBG_16_72_14]